MNFVCFWGSDVWGVQLTQGEQSKRGHSTWGSRDVLFLWSGEKYNWKFIFFPDLNTAEIWNNSFDVSKMCEGRKLFSPNPGPVYFSEPFLEKCEPLANCAAVSLLCVSRLNPVHPGADPEYRAAAPFVTRISTKCNIKIPFWYNLQLPSTNSLPTIKYVCKPRTRVLYPHQ